MSSLRRSLTAVCEAVLAAASGNHRRRLGRQLALRRRRARQIEADRGTEADFRLDPRIAARLLDEAVDHAEAEPAALADLLRREEWLEGLGECLGRHAGSGIGDADQAVVAALDAEAGGGRAVVDLRPLRLDRQRP